MAITNSAISVGRPLLCKPAINGRVSGKLGAPNSRTSTHMPLRSRGRHPLQHRETAMTSEELAREITEVILDAQVDAETAFRALQGAIMFRMSCLCIDCRRNVA